MKYYVETIHWQDHFSTSGWRDPEKFKDAPTSIVSVGLRVKENKKTITLATTVDPEDGGFIGSITILKNCITKRKKHGQI